MRSFTEPFASVMHEGRYVGIVRRVPGFNGLRWEARQYGQLEGERFATRPAAIAWLASLPPVDLDDEDEDDDYNPLDPASMRRHHRTHTVSGGRVI